MTLETIISQEGDSIDLIAFKRFGDHGMETAIYEANPGLAQLGPALPIGTKVLIPAPGIPNRASGQNIWGDGE